MNRTMVGSQQRQTAERSTKEAAKKSGTSLAVLAAEASVLLSLYEFFLRGNRMRGLYIGLWPPTILAFASYFNQKRMEEKMGMSALQDVGERISRMVENR